MRRPFAAFALSLSLVACGSGLPDDAPAPNATAIPTGAPGATGVALGASPTGPPLNVAAPDDDGQEFVPPGPPPTPPDPFDPGVPPAPSHGTPHKHKRPKGTNL